MRSLRAFVLISTGLVSFLAPIITSAVEHKHTGPDQRPGVLLEVRNRYSEQWTKVSKEGQKWVCRSGELPYFETSKDPLRELNWDQLALASKQVSSECHEQAVIVDSRTKPSKKITSCGDFPQTKYWIDTIAKRCGRL